MNTVNSNASVINGVITADTEVLACTDPKTCKEVYLAYVKGVTEAEIIAIQQKYAREYTNFRVMTWDAWEAIDLEQSKVDYNFNIAIATDAADFKEMFNILPPVRHSKDENFEHFEMCERLTGNITTHLVRAGQGATAQYYRINALIGESLDNIQKMINSAKATA